MQEIIKGDTKKRKERGRRCGGGDGADGRKGRREGAREGRREGGRKKERRRRRVNITAPWQANMRCWDTSTKKKKKPPFIR